MDGHAHLIHYHSASEGQVESMKKSYEKPMLCVERYSLSQSIVACSGIKIYSSSGTPGKSDVLKDPDSTYYMIDWANKGGFLADGAGCAIKLNGYTDRDGVCYHTNANAAFNS